MQQNNETDRDTLQQIFLKPHILIRLRSVLNFEIHLAASNVQFMSSLRRQDCTRVHLEPEYLSMTATLVAGLCWRGLRKNVTSRLGRSIIFVQSVLSVLVSPL